MKQSSSSGGIGLTSVDHRIRRVEIDRNPWVWVLSPLTGQLG